MSLIFSKFDDFGLNRDKAIALGIWLKIHTNISVNLVTCDNQQASDFFFFGFVFVFCLFFCFVFVLGNRMCGLFEKAVIKETKLYFRVKINGKTETKSRHGRFQNARE